MAALYHCQMVALQPLSQVSYVPRSSVLDAAILPRVRLESPSRHLTLGDGPPIGPRMQPLSRFDRYHRHPSRPCRTRTGLHSEPAVLVCLLVVMLAGAACSSAPPLVLPPLPAVTGGPVSYREQVQPVLERRCVVCHGCYDAPCQLLLSSPEGIERGASKEVVYDTDRLTAMQPTRLFIDAHSTAEWRERGFFSVTGDPDAANSPALLLLMLQLGRAHPFAPGEKLPESVGLDINRALTCPRPRSSRVCAAASARRHALRHGARSATRSSAS